MEREEGFLPGIALSFLQPLEEHRQEPIEDEYLQGNIMQVVPFPQISGSLPDSLFSPEIGKDHAIEHMAL